MLFPFFFFFGFGDIDCLVHCALTADMLVRIGKRVNHPSWVDVPVVIARASITAYKMVHGICARQTLPDPIGQGLRH